LQKLSDGRLSIQSEDQSVRVVLHPSGKRFAACFPLLVNHSRAHDAAADSVPTFTYFWQTQVFAEADYPARWRYPISLLLAAAADAAALARMLAARNTSSECGQQHNPDASEETDAALHEQTTSPEAQRAHGADAPAASRIPHAPGRPSAASRSSPECLDGPQRQPADQDEPVDTALALMTLESGAESRCQLAAAPSVLERTTHLPQAMSAAVEGPNFFKEGSWWTECALDPLPREVRSADTPAHNLIGMWLPYLQVEQAAQHSKGWRGA
jgi:hypothetical protein